MEKDKTVCLRVESDLYDALAEIADGWGLTVSSLTRKLLLMYVIEHQKEKGKEDEHAKAVQ